MEKALKLFILTSQKPAMGGKVVFFLSTALGELLDVLATFFRKLESFEISLI